MYQCRKSTPLSDVVIVNEAMVVVEEVEKVKREEGRGEDPSLCYCSSLFRILIRHVTLSSIVANDDDSDNGEDDDVDDESEG